MDLRYVEADERVVRQIAELSRKEYGDVELSSLSYLRWKHLENPHGTSKFYLLYDGEQLIGKLGLLPRKFWRNDESINAAYLVDLLIDKEHRGLRTFLLLMSCLTQNPDFDFLFLTPNSNSMLLYERVLKFYKPFQMDAMAFPLDAASLIGFKIGKPQGPLSRGLAKVFQVALSSLLGLMSVFLPRIGLEMTETPQGTDLSPKCIPTDIFFGDRSGEFLGWRFRMPKYESFHFSGGFGTLSQQKYLGLNTFFVMDLFTFDDMSALRRGSILLALVREGLRRRCDLVFMFGNRRLLSRKLVSGFPLLGVPEKALPQPTPVFFWELKKGALKGLKKGNFALSAADLDVF